MSRQMNFGIENAAAIDEWNLRRTYIPQTCAGECGRHVEYHRREEKLCADCAQAKVDAADRMDGMREPRNTFSPFNKVHVAARNFYRTAHRKRY